MPNPKMKHTPRSQALAKAYGEGLRERRRELLGGQPDPYPWPPPPASIDAGRSFKADDAMQTMTKSDIVEAVVDWRNGGQDPVFRDEIIKAAVMLDALDSIPETWLDDIEKYDTSSLATKPGKKDNWIEAKGGTLPPFVRAIAHALMRERGMSRSHAIALAIAATKRWAAGGGNVTPKTRAKAAKTVAAWERLKTK